MFFTTPLKADGKFVIPSKNGKSYFSAKKKANFLIHKNNSSPFLKFKNVPQMLWTQLHDKQY